MKEKWELLRKEFEVLSNKVRTKLNQTSHRLELTLKDFQEYEKLLETLLAEFKVWETKIKRIC
jgi:hypothetical protein